MKRKKKRQKDFFDIYYETLSLRGKVDKNRIFKVLNELLEKASTLNQWELIQGFAPIGSRASRIAAEKIAMLSKKVA